MFGKFNEESRKVLISSLSNGTSLLLNLPISSFNNKDVPFDKELIKTYETRYNFYKSIN